MFDYYAAIGSFRRGPDFLMACLELPLGCIGRACTQWSPAACLSLPSIGRTMRPQIVLALGKLLML
jgi:hypothetical protein